MAVDYFYTALLRPPYIFVYTLAKRELA